MIYNFKFRHKYWPFYKTIKLCGHLYDHNTDRIDLYLSDNRGIISIGNWSNYTFYLDKDFIEANKEKMEEDSGQTIPLRKNNS